MAKKEKQNFAQKSLAVVEDNPKTAIGITAVLASAALWLGPLISALAPLLGLTCIAK